MSALLVHAAHAILAQTNPTIPTNPANPTAPATTPTGPEFPTVLLTSLVFSSMACALIILFLPERTRDQRGRIRIMGLVGTVIPLLFTVGGLNFQMGQEFSGGTISFEEKHNWIDSFPIHATYTWASTASPCRCSSSPPSPSPWRRWRPGATT